jgi:DNA-binding response OmpR family regulator
VIVPKVLLVEDHEDTRLMYAEFLGDNFEVIQASDGEGALEAMRVRVPDLVITDVSLPGVDGFELIKRMRGDSTLARVPVICLSGYSTDAIEERAREAGCARLLQKPCLPDALAATVKGLLENEDARRPAR